MASYKKALIYLVVMGFVMLFFFAQSTKASHQFVTKMKLVYEVTDVTVVGQSFVIEGWAFINESQHYLDDGNMTGKVVLLGNSNNLQYPMIFHQQDMTYLMKMDGRRRCGSSEYNKPASECYYDYRNVGFRTTIPFADLQDQTSYSLQFLLDAKQANKLYSNDIFFVSSNAKTVKHLDREIAIKASVHDARFVINHDYVLVRTAPSKTSGVHQGSNCSATFGRDLYFEPLSQYNDVRAHSVINHVTWYQVYTMPNYCSTMGRNYVKEGGSLAAWIPSSYVEYNGVPATITVSKPNSPPTLDVTNPTIYMGDTSFNPDDYVSAYDEKDGVLLPKRGMGNWNVNKIGTYVQQYSVTDSDGLSATKLMTIRVIAKPANTPPNITAKDRTVYQYSEFKPREGAKAMDLEDGDITSNIVVQKNIDVTLLGIQELCLYVEDKEGLSDMHCINVLVIPYPKFTVATSIRFMDQQRLFYKESIPVLWRGRLHVIQDAIANSVPILSETFR